LKEEEKSINTVKIYIQWTFFNSNKLL